MVKRIPIQVAKNIAKAFDLKQVILVAWDGQKTHVVTYGTSLQDCDEAAMGGNAVKKALGWPESLCNEETSRVKKLKHENETLKAKAAHLESRIAALVGTIANPRRQ